MFKIYYTNKVITILQDQDTHLIDRPDFWVENIFSENWLTRLRSFLLTPDAPTFTLLAPNPEQAFEFLKEQFEFVEAAGGLVRNSNQLWLMIYRYQKWDLPKGKIEKGEGVAEAALREVEEECGINQLQLVQPLPSTYHIYILKNTFHLKQTYWFEMRYTGNQTPAPQLEEQITEVKWMKKEEVIHALTNSYPAIQQVLSPFLVK